MPNVVRFTLSTALDLYVAGAGWFRSGVMDVDANELEQVERTRYLVQPYQAVEVGIVDSATPLPVLPAVPGPPAPDPYPQYLTSDEIVNDPAVRAAFAPVGAVRNATRRANPGGIPAKVSLPSGLGWAAPLNLFKSGRSYFTDFDVADFKNTGGATWYVDPAAGNNSNAGTSAGAAFATLLKAYQSAASGDTIVVVGDGVIAHRPSAWNAQRIKKSLNIIAQTPGGVTFSYSDALTYALDSGNVYSATRSNVRAVVDMSVGPYGYRFTNVASVAACQALPGSWYQSGTTLYVHALDGASPGSTVLALLAGEGWYANSDDQAVTVYLEGIRLVGSNTGNLTADSTTNTVDVYAKDCEFLWSTATDGAGDALNINGARYAYFQDCVAAYATKDGFNYTAVNNAAVTRDAPKFIEVGCHSFGHGLDNSVPGQSDTHNASTAHTGALGVRVGGLYHDTMGAIVADVQTGTKSANYSCTAYDSRTENESYNAAWSAQQSGAEMWLFDCVAFGTTYDIYAVTGTTMHLDDCEYVTTQGGGTLDVA